MSGKWHMLMNLVKILELVTPLCSLLPFFLHTAKYLTVVWRLIVLCNTVLYKYIQLSSCEVVMFSSIYYPWIEIKYKAPQITVIFQFVKRLVVRGPIFYRTYVRISMEQQAFYGAEQSLVTLLVGLGKKMCKTSALKLFLLNNNT